MLGEDDTLLARLNALKPSSVSLDKSLSASQLDHEASKPATLEDKLAERLKRLRTSKTSASAKDTNGPEVTVADELVNDAAPKYDLSEDWQHSQAEEPDIEALLAELGSDESWALAPDDSSHIAPLLNEAKDALPGEQSPSPNHPDRGSPVGEGKETSLPAAEGSNTPNDTHGEEEEADDYVQKVLAELALEEKYLPEYSNVEVADNHESASYSLNLPSTPSCMLQSSQTVEPPSYEDSQLEARFSRLGRDLPSTPEDTLLPRAKAPAKPAGCNVSKAKTKTQLQVYSDEDVRSWCCICNEDGEVRCLGCDSDIYCQSCWREGHGTGPGQEKGHNAVQYNKNGPKAVALA